MSLAAIDYRLLMSESYICVLYTEYFVEHSLHSLVDLPVVEAIYKEVLRWNPVAPFTVPRTLTADDVFRGRFGAY